MTLKPPVITATTTGDSTASFARDVVLVAGADRVDVGDLGLRRRTLDVVDLYQFRFVSHR